MAECRRHGAEFPGWMPGTHCGGSHNPGTVEKRDRLAGFPSAKRPVRASRRSRTLLQSCRPRREPAKVGRTVSGGFHAIDNLAIGGSPRGAGDRGGRARIQCYGHQWRDADPSGARWRRGSRGDGDARDRRRQDPDRGRRHHARAAPGREGHRRPRQVGRAGAHRLARALLPVRQSVHAPGRGGFQRRRAVCRRGQAQQGAPARHLQGLARERRHRRRGHRRAVLEFRRAGSLARRPMPHRAWPLRGPSSLS